MKKPTIIKQSSTPSDLTKIEDQMYCLANHANIGRLFLWLNDPNRKSAEAYFQDGPDLKLALAIERITPKCNGCEYKDTNNGPKLLGMFFALLLGIFVGWWTSSFFLKAKLVDANEKIASLKTKSDNFTETYRDLATRLAIDKNNEAELQQIIRSLELKIRKADYALENGHTLRASRILNGSQE